MLPKTIHTYESSKILIEIKSDGVVHYYHKSDSTLELHDQQNIIDFLKSKLGNVPQYGMVVRTGEFSKTSKEASQLARANEENGPIKVVALIMPDLSSRILANFYFSFYKSVLTFKIFKVQDEAEEWLYDQLLSLHESENTN